MAEMRTAQPTTKNKIHGIALLYSLFFPAVSFGQNAECHRKTDATSAKKKNKILTENGI